MDMRDTDMSSEIVGEIVLSDPFMEAEQYVGLTLPSWLKKMLMINGYNNSKVIGSIDDKDIVGIEEFGRTTLPDIIDSSEYGEYYGVFQNNISKFKMLEGFKKQLMLVVNYYSKKNIGEADGKRKLTEVSQINEVKRVKKASEKNISQNSKINLSTTKTLINVDLEIDLSEEKKAVLHTVSEWLKSNYYSTNEKLVDHMILNQSVTVALSSSNDFENEDINEKILAQITCFCGTSSKVFKTVSRAHAKKRWILSNYYRHLNKHFLNNDVQSKKIKGKLITNTSSTNNIQNYFSPVQSLSNYENPQPCSTSILDNKEISQDISHLPIATEKTHSLTTTSKWKDPKYNRSNREKRRYEKSLLSDDKIQLVMTDFYEMVNSVKAVMVKSSILKDSLEDLKQNSPLWVQTDAEKLLENTMPSTFLQSLIKSSINNSSSTSKNSNRYKKTMKQFSVFLYFVGGRLLYETLQANLENSLPSITTLYRFISTQKSNVVEGEYRFDALKIFLEERKLPMCVWVSEDGTRISSKIEFDSLNNKIVGFVLPFKNGRAVIDSFLATSAKTIAQYFENNIKADYAYVIMAKPLVDKAPSFCLCIYGTDNRFNYNDVIARWNVMTEMATNVGIKILGFSSDGDTRLLKAMRIKNALSNSSQSYVQDVVHIATKLRTRILKPGIILPMGDNHVVSISHLKTMTETFSKDKHLLTNTDLNPIDKMNFRSAEKMCSLKVIQILKNIPDSEATIIFLRTMNDVLTAFLDKTISVEDRIYLMWRSLYFLRMWRYFILKNKKFTLRNNFLSTNVYTCIELNAESLIILVKKFRDNNYTLRTSMFMPWNFSSQPCEDIFRTTRSMTSTYNTVVNFSMNDLLKRLTRIELLSHIQNDLGTDPDTDHNILQDKFIFPRQQNHSRNFINKSSTLIEAEFEELSDEYILSILNRSLMYAKELASSIGITIDEDSSKRPEYLSNQDSEDNCENNEEDDIDEIEKNESTESIVTDNISEDIFGDLSKIAEFGNFGDKLNLKDFSNNFKLLDSIANSVTTSKSSGLIDINLSSEFVPVKMNDDEKIIVKKSSLCWLFDNKTQRISNDRLMRFITNKKKFPSKLPCTSNQKPLNLKNIKISAKNKLQKMELQDTCNTTMSSMTMISPAILMNDKLDENFSRPVIIGDFVLVRYKGKKFFQYFVGCVESTDGDDFEVSFLKRNIGNTFYYPSHQEVDTISKSDIEKILPKPKPAGNSERCTFLLIFEDVDFTNYKMG